MNNNNNIFEKIGFTNYQIFMTLIISLIYLCEVALKIVGKIN